MNLSETILDNEMLGKDSSLIYQNWYIIYYSEIPVCASIDKDDAISMMEKRFGKKEIKWEPPSNYGFILNYHIGRIRDE